ncbi:MAG: hypothetical protein L0387_24535, partial [Acidobacteria bacterium]|nr:hypothetical protein [Acidobacteriota bacterium]
HCQPIQFSESISPAPGRTAGADVAATFRSPSVSLCQPEGRRYISQRDCSAGKMPALQKKKPGVERRVSLPHTLAGSLVARLISSRYP